MHITYSTQYRGKSSPRIAPIQFGVVHTTEGQEKGDLAALTTDVSIYRYIPRRKALCFNMVDADRIAYHVGWARLGDTGPWLNHWNGITYGWEIGHKQSEPWVAEHLARSLHIIRADTLALKLPKLVRHMDLAKGRPQEYNGNRNDPTDFPFWESFRTLCFRPPYPLTGPADINLDTFRRVAMRTLSAEDATAAYLRIVARGFRPGPLLALWGVESTFGTDGVAVSTRNWGNVRTPMVPSRSTGTTGGFVQYASWLDSLDDLLDRFEHRTEYLAGGNTDLTTTRIVYAPVGDGANDPFRDSLKMLGWIDAWAQEPPQDTIATTPTPTGYAVHPGLLAFWERSGGVWQRDRFALGYPTSDLVDTVQRFERGALRLKADGSVDALLLSECV